MNNDALWQKLMELSVVCGMNQRYSQHFMTEAKWYSQTIDTAVLVFTILTVVLAVSAYFAPSLSFPYVGWRWKGQWVFVRRINLAWMSFIASLLAATAGVLLVASPANKDLHHFSTMFSSWSDLRLDVDSALVDAESPASNVSQEYLQRRYRDLLARKNALNSRESDADDALLLKFLEEEEASRGFELDENKEAELTSTVMSVNDNPQL